MVWKCHSFHLPLTQHIPAASIIRQEISEKYQCLYVSLHPFIGFLFIRWEEEKYEDGVKWRFLEHSGPYFPPEYQPLPDNVHFYYDGWLFGNVEHVKCSHS